MRYKRLMTNNALAIRHNPDFREKTTMRMNTTPQTASPRSWLARLLGMFNLNDGRWGRDKDGHPTFDPNGQASSDEKKPDQPNQRPQAAGGPPDLDELWRDFNAKLSGLLGGRKGGGSEPPGHGGPTGPDFKVARFGVGVIVAVVVAIWCSTGFFIVQEGQQAVITQFGRYHSTVGAGFNWRLP